LKKKKEEKENRVSKADALQIGPYRLFSLHLEQTVLPSTSQENEDSSACCAFVYGNLPSTFSCQSRCDSGCGESAHAGHPLRV
jgi:hypothetical protein